MTIAICIAVSWLLGMMVGCVIGAESERAKNAFAFTILNEAKRKAEESLMYVTRDYEMLGKEYRQIAKRINDRQI